MANEPTPGQAASEGVTENPATPAPAAASENITATPPAPAAASENITATPPAPPPPAAAAPAPSAPAPMAAAGPGALPAWLLKADVAILAMLLLLTFFLGSFTAANSDVWMHLAIGQRISTGDFTFGVDPFSWLTEATDDMPASFWVHQSWLYSWLFFQLHELVGGGGLVFIKALLCTIAVGLLSRIGWNETNRWFVLITLVTAVLAVSPRLLLQPVVISLLFLSITLFVLDRVGFFVTLAPRTARRPCPRFGAGRLPPLFAAVGEPRCVVHPGADRARAVLGGGGADPLVPAGTGGAGQDAGAGIWRERSGVPGESVSRAGLPAAAGAGVHCRGGDRCAAPEVAQ